MLLLTKLSYSGIRVAYVIHRQEELNREFIHNSSTNELLLINDFANHCFCMPALNDVLDYFYSGFVLGFAVIVRWAMYYLMISIAGRQVRCISLVLKSN